jgi:hypothetical protein
MWFFGHGLDTVGSVNQGLSSSGRGQDGSTTGARVNPEEPRRQLTTSDPSGLCVHDHAAWCGDGPETLDRIAVSTFSAAAERGELMVFVSDDPDPHRLAGLARSEDLIARGSLQLLSVEDTYGHFSDSAAQLFLFEELLERALADGHTGISVVADNSSLAAGSDEEFAAWLDWEATADALQATRPVGGVCYFDRRRVSSERMADLAVMHPVLSADFQTPSFQIFVDGDAVRVVGAVDYFCIEQLRRILDAAPRVTERVLDISGAEFIHHGALWALNDLAVDGHSVRLCGANGMVQRVWKLLDLESPALDFC